MPAVIKLTKGLSVLVDKRLIKSLSKHKWYASFSEPDRPYAVASIQRKGRRCPLYMHRFILKARKGQVCDHKNGDTLDCRKSNLRLCDTRQNAMNMRHKRTAKTSKYKGVCFTKNRFLVQIKFKEKKVSKTFLKEIDAAKFYNELARKFFGKFAYLNKV